MLLLQLVRILEIPSQLARTALEVIDAIRP